MIKRSVLCSAVFALALVLLPGGSLLAQEAEPRIVVIDGQRVTTETSIGQRVGERVQGQMSDWQSRVQEAQQSLQSLTQRRQQQEMTLSPEALADLNVQIEEAQVALERVQSDAQRAMQRLQQEAMQEINAVLIPVLEEMSTTASWDIVLDAQLAQTGGLLYYSDAVDITDEFIAQVDAATATEPEQRPEQ